MEPRRFFRFEGVALFVSALGGDVALDGPLWLLAVLALVPDLSMLGYLAGPRVGSLTYNVVHIYAPARPRCRGTPAGSRLSLLVALVHIGAGRAFGYGLEFESEFKDTHLSTQPAPTSFLGDTE